MITTMTISETQKSISKLEHSMKYDDTISITDNGKEVFALMRWDMYESIIETLDILSDNALLDDIKIGMGQIRNNELVDFESFKDSLACMQ